MINYDWLVDPEKLSHKSYFRKRCHGFPPGTPSASFSSPPFEGNTHTTLIQGRIELSQRIPFVIIRKFYRF